jgi:tRNA threonylcarbamoyladenosine biosynthesis protein TsaB
LDFAPAAPKLAGAMARLTQLLANHGSILVLDAASQRVQVGLLQLGKTPLWQATPDEAGRGVFAGTEAVLQQAGLGIGAVGAFLFCEGPGSMLGTRTVAMALRTWLALKPRPVYHYQSLTLLAHELRHANSPAPFSLITDARRDTWHCVTSTAAGIQPLRRVAVAELAALPGDLFQPTAFRAWATAPRPVKDCTYDVAALLAGHAEADLCTATDAPDAFQHEAPEYKKWSAQAHSAATASPR